MNRLKQLYFGQDIGYCRVCGNKNELSKDHFPPYSSGNNSRVEIKSFKSRIISQNGMKFKTICYYCNNNLLSEFDKEQKEILSKFSNFENDIRIYNAPYIGINTNTYRLMRGILGHYLGICFADNIIEIMNKPLKNSRFYEEIRQFVLGRVFSLDIAQIYYWYYPYDDIRICQFEAYIPEFTYGNKNPIYGGIIKFYPLAYWIVNGEVTRIVPNLERMKIKDENQLLRVRSDKIFGKIFLEKPDKDSAILMSKDGRIETNKY